MPHIILMNYVLGFKVSITVLTSTSLDPQWLIN